MGGWLLEVIGMAADTAVASSGGWVAADDRPDPVELVVAQDDGREQDLVPVRHGRMAVSPFTFYRGAATVMAHDLRGSPTAGLNVQLCGDAHLSNFGFYASPERRLVFDLNDFDETLPGPFEFDVKRLAASFTIAARNNGFSPADAKAAAVTAVRAYRQSMAQFAAMGHLKVWYAQFSADTLRERLADLVAEAAKADKKPKRDQKASKEISRSGKSGTSAAKASKAVKSAKSAKSARSGKQPKSGGSADKTAGKAEVSTARSLLPEGVRYAEKALEKARTRGSLQALSKLATVVDGRYQIVSQPPLLVPMRDVSAYYDYDPADALGVLDEQFKSYRESLADDRRVILDRYRFVDAARKVVGVGSVGTRCYIQLMQGVNSSDPLFLQMKEANRSVLEVAAPRSRYVNQGKRVVVGQHLTQASSDIFLGWSNRAGGRNFYWRQLRDMKASVEVERLREPGLLIYAEVCGWTLAHAHARSGDAVAISAYLGDDDAFDKAIGRFAVDYAERNEHDYTLFTQAIATGRIRSAPG